MSLNGLIGLGPHQLQKDDNIVVLFGADMPFILRSAGNHCRLIGPAYVHSLMDGESLKEFKTDDELKEDMVTP